MIYVFLLGAFALFLAVGGAAFEKLLDNCPQLEKWLFGLFGLDV